MSRIALPGAFFCIATTALALMTTVAGNKPLSPENYQAWPHLIDAINDTSRVYHVWVNGAEYFSYHGDTTAVNRVLKEFSETDNHELHVWVLPGPGPVKVIDKSELTVDYQIEIMGGIAGAHFQRLGTSTVRTVEPVMKIYVTERVKLDELQIPGNVKISELDDLEQRYLIASEQSDEQLQKDAIQHLEALHKEFRKQGDDYDKMQQQIGDIHEFVTQFRAANSPSSESSP